MTQKRIAVLLSSFNGEKYITEQLDSILEQKNVLVSIFVRDDGSTDQTLKILEKYSEEGKVEVVTYPKKNLGVGSSFMELLYHVGTSYDYYCFSDQDDIWLDSKLEKGIEKISEIVEPTLYCSNQIIVDEKLQSKGLRHGQLLDVSTMQILNANKLSGCTMIWNKSLQELLIERKPSERLLSIRIHDVWVAIVASIVGQIVYDSESYILYRQHDNNVVGVKKTLFLSRWMKKISQNKLRGRSLLASELLDKYPDYLTSDKKEKLEKVAYYSTSFSKKINLIKNLTLVSDYSEEPKWLIVAKIFFDFL